MGKNKKKTIYKDSVFSLFKFLSQKNKNKLALQSVFGLNLSFKGLFEQLDVLIGKLHSFGIKKNNRIVIVLPQGVEMTMACLLGLSCACIAPLNPIYKKKEFDFYFSDIKPSLLITLRGFDSEALKVAQEKNIPIARIFLKGFGFDLELPQNKEVSTERDLPGLDDISLVLHTSGTTSNPKLVPLIQKNIIFSANNTIDSLELGEDDRCLDLMPIFHIHGLVVTLSALFSGGSVISAPKFEKNKFFNWLDEFKPTWYTGVPTVHQVIIKESRENKEILEKNKIKKIRSSSAPLSPEILSSLEGIFNCPVLESYGMTEAALQITSNQLPPGKRKPGSAGKANNLELAIIDEEDNFLEKNKLGEIIIKGENVMSGYENNLKANKESFINGWLRTGDLGYLDKDDFLFIKGRAKEMVNRGGEKIFLREIDEALLRNNKIEQGVGFIAPHPSLGEEIFAAVILKSGRKVTERDIKEKLRKKISDFKIPKRIIFVSDIPKGPSGKLKRIDLYNQLKRKGYFDNIHRDSDRGVENTLIDIWRKVLEKDNIGIDDNFFELGGSSLELVEIVTECRKKNIKIESDKILEYPSVKGLAEFIRNNN
ncbi:non-ribosomal peptide synthetase [bacterium]|nr:non-ribosomal peptide synthetase [bacterium]